MCLIATFICTIDPNIENNQAEYNPDTTELKIILGYGLVFFIQLISLESN